MATNETPKKYAIAWIHQQSKKKNMGANEPNYTNSQISYSARWNANIFCHTSSFFFFSALFAHCRCDTIIRLWMRRICRKLSFCVFYDGNWIRFIWLHFSRTISINDNRIFDIDKMTMCENIWITNSDDLNNTPFMS